MRARALALAMLFAASGCTGDDGRSKEDFVAQADELCGSASTQVRGLGSLEPAMFTDSSRRRALERWFSGFVETVGANLEDLRALEQPEGEAAALDRALFRPRQRVVSHASETLALVRANGTPVASSRARELLAAAAAATSRATRYGFAECAEILR